MMKIDVSYEALLQALVEAIRDERDHGMAMMSLVSRLVDEACRQDWFEAHWRTGARLRLAQMACGHMAKGWRSAVPVLEVIAEAARGALKADEVDDESQATLLAIMRLADFERSTQAAVQPKPRPAANYARRRKANGASRIRRVAQPAKPAAPQTMAIAATRPAAAKAAPAGKTKRSKRASRSHAPAQLANAPASAQAVAVAKARAATAKATRVRKAKRTKPTSRSHTAAPLAKPAAPPLRAPVAKATSPAKAAPARKTKRSKPVSRTHSRAPLAKPVAPSQQAPGAKAPSPAKTAPARKPNGAGQASTKLGAPAIVT